MATYKTNFIKKVILRIDFNNPIESIDEEFFGKFKSSLSKNYDELDFHTKEARELTANFSDADQSFSFKTLGKIGIYSIPEENIKFDISNSYFLLETNKYIKFDDFYNHFKFGINELKQLVEIEHLKRIGLRFINLIKDDSIQNVIEWNKYINEDFIPNFNSIYNINDRFNLRRGMNEYIYSDGDYRLRLYYGLWNNDFPGKITNNEFVLDIDCSLNMLVSGDEVLEEPKKMRDHTYDFFSTIITDNLKEKMGVKENE